jgi:hypothetical protein
MLAYKVATNTIDGYYKIIKSTIIKKHEAICRAIQRVFKSAYLLQFTKIVIERPMEVNAQKGFPGMFTFIDCMHDQWMNCHIS